MERERDGGPPLSFRSISLRPLQASDYPALHRLETSSPIAWRWRQRGRTQSMEDFLRSIWLGVLVQFLVVDSDGRPLGLVMAFDVDLRNGITRIGLLKFEPDDRRPGFLIGCALFIDYLFYWWPLRKLYAETPASNFKQMASGGSIGVFDIEGELRDYAYRDGAYESVYMLAISKVTWEPISGFVLGSGA